MLHLFHFLNNAENGFFIRCLLMGLWWSTSPSALPRLPEGVFGRALTEPGVRL